MKWRGVFCSDIKRMNFAIIEFEKGRKKIIVKKKYCRQKILKAKIN